MRTLTWLVAFGLTAAAGRVVTFDNGPLGKIPPEWTVAMTNHGRPPRWEIVKDMSAATQPYVLAQVSTDPLRDRYPLAIFNEATFRDGEVSVRLKPVSGREVQAGGIVWRYKDENNYYLARANALEKNVQVFKVENGVRKPLMAGVHHEIPSNAWSILKVAARGQSLPGLHGSPAHSAGLGQHLHGRRQGRPVDGGRLGDLLRRIPRHAQVALLLAASP